jgi:hypothetical protein
MPMASVVHRGASVEFAVVADSDCLDIAHDVPRQPRTESLAQGDLNGDLREPQG